MTRKEAHLTISEIVEHLVDYQDGYGKINTLVNQIFNDFDNLIDKEEITWGR